MKRFFLFCVCLVLGLALNLVRVKGDTLVVEDGKRVSFDYTLTVEDEVVDSSEGIGPFSYVHGKGEIIPGLAEELEGMEVGQTKTIQVPPEDAYGKVSSQAFQEIPKDSLPEGLEVQPDMVLQMETPQGEVVPVLVSEVKEDSIVLDLNHPLAGKNLTFEVAIISIE